ncbi:hypothetical protein DXG01_002474 [Tephrocybe rancida]|nr:hypothetical protein DXG01_002474 [Tephrocybe rancida]
MGEMVYVNVLGNSILVLGSARRATDIFEKHSTNYSDRVQLPMLDLMGWNFSFATMSYSPWWRRHRKCFHEHFHFTATQKYQPVQLRESRALLRRLLDTPDDFLQHTRHGLDKGVDPQTSTVAAIIVKITYGIPISERNDAYITNAEEATDSLAQAGVPGAFFVDLLPILRYIPAWMPGAGFQRKAAHWRTVIKETTDRPFFSVKTKFNTGTASPSIVTTLLENLPEGEERTDEETIARQSMDAAYAGGSDTTASSSQAFLLAMAMYPEVQAKAQAELDAVVGNDRLPDFNDRASLPYIDAVVKEVIRWQPVTPLAVAHFSMADDEYNGYFIPAKTIVIGNSWSILRDPEMYPSPEEFNPDRFLKDGKPNDEIRNPNTAAFGFGRRVVVAILSVFKIEPPLDDTGRPVQLSPAMSSGLLSYPLPFPCRITPRSKTAAQLIRASGEHDVDSMEVQ